MNALVEVGVAVMVGVSVIVKVAVIVGLEVTVVVLVGELPLVLLPLFPGEVGLTLDPQPKKSTATNIVEMKITQIFLEEAMIPTTIH
jgi:hypothetical protein